MRNMIFKGLKVATAMILQKVVSWRQWKKDWVNVGTSGFLQENQTKKQTFRCQVSPLVTAEGGCKQLFKPCAQAGNNVLSDNIAPLTSRVQLSGQHRALAVRSLIQEAGTGGGRMEKLCGHPNQGINVSTGASQYTDRLTHPCTGTFA